jgi:probable rRNA maturation factor
MPLVANLQRKVDIKGFDIRSFASDLISSVPEAAGSDFSVALVSDRRMIELNKLFRGKDTTTDVLSFPAEPDEFEKLHVASREQDQQLGDIVVSVEQAARQAAENKLTLENELKQLVLHGLLHLLGFDHETDTGEMNKRELELRDKLGIS